MNDDTYPPNPDVINALRYLIEEGFVKEFKDDAGETMYRLKTDEEIDAEVDAL
jgi:Fe2+ or Zn2+ uptake regulation protein